jgi:hypothetical protein
MQTPDERLACFEAKVDSAMGERAAEPEDDARERRTRSAEPAEKEAADRREVVSTIVALRQTVPNSYLITLENGQIWRQMRPKKYLLRPGQEVRLYPTRWGEAFRLTAGDANSFIQVERVR